MQKGYRALVNRIGFFPYFFPGIKYGKNRELYHRFKTARYQACMNFLPSLASFPLSEKQSQFAKAPTDPLFLKGDRVFVITGVDATGAWTISYRNSANEPETRSGSGSREWHHPFIATKIESTSGIDLLCGYYVRLK